MLVQHIQSLSTISSTCSFRGGHLGQTSSCQSLFGMCLGHFGSRLWLKASFRSSTFVFPCKTTFNASQEMAVSRCAVWVGASSEGATPSVSEMATSAGGASSTFRKVAPAQREVVFTTVHTTTASSGQPFSRSCRRRRSCRGEEVGECDPGVGGDEPARTAVGRGIEGGPCEDDSASSPEADPVLQDFSRTCQATCCSSRKCHCQGRRAERNLRQGGLRRREPPPDENVRRGFSPCARLSAARRTRVAKADRRVEKGTRFVESRTNTDSQGASRDVVRGWSAICEGDPTHANRPPRVARLDQRTQLRSQERSATVAKMVSLISQGTAQLAVGSRDVVMDGSTRSALMASLIEESDAKRRVVQGANTSAFPSVVGNQV